MMQKFGLFDVLQYLRPNASFAAGLEKNDTIEWFDSVYSEPSREEIDAAWDEAYEAYLLTHIRNKRNVLLEDSDWTQVADAPVDAAAWAEYRQALRDLPANTIDPENPVWPTPPE